MTAGFAPKHCDKLLEPRNEVEFKYEGTASLFRLTKSGYEP